MYFADIFEGSGIVCHVFEMVRLLTVTLRFFANASTHCIAQLPSITLYGTLCVLVASNRVECFEINERAGAKISFVMKRHSSISHLKTCEQCARESRKLEETTKHTCEKYVWLRCRLTAQFVKSCTTHDIVRNFFIPV